MNKNLLKTIAVGSGLWLMGIGQANAQVTTQTYSFTGSMQTFTVPAGVSQATITVNGASGANGLTAPISGQSNGALGGNGGLGSQVSGVYNTTAGQVLNIFAGGAASGATGGYNGGANGTDNSGGGGGASDVRFGGTALSNRILVAGGGGGGGNGGSASFTLTGGDGGNGGGNGSNGTNSVGGTGGQGGQGSTGGAPGTGCSFATGTVGINGTAGVGGTGGNGYTIGSTPSGGGGGGGYVGGGGGGGGTAGTTSCTLNDEGAGGGGAGGSNYTDPSLTSTSIINGIVSGDGSVTITYGYNAAALNFDGTGSNYVAASSNAAMGIGANDFTIEADFQANGSQPNYAGLVVKADAGGGWKGVQLVVVNDHIAAEFTDGTTFFGTGAGLEGTTNISDGSWHHLAITVNHATSTINLYVDGAVDASLTDPAIATMDVTNGSDLILGAERTLGYFLNGTVDEVRIWNHALCATEIQNYMNAEVKLPNSGLNVYYKFNQGLAAADNTAGFPGVADSSGNFFVASSHNFAFNGTTSNWVAPGAVTSGSYSPVYTAPTISITGTTTACANMATMLTASGASTYTWNPGNSTANPFAAVSSLPGATNYSVSGTTAAGCPTMPAAITVTVMPSPILTNSSGNTHVCDSTTAVYSITSDNPNTDAYQWTWVPVSNPTADSLDFGIYNETGYTTNSMTITPEKSTMWGPSGYWGVHCIVTNTLTGCYTKGPIDTIFFNPLPTIVANNTSICLGTSLTITPSGGISYTVTGGSTVVTPTTTTSYTITGTDANGCMNSTVMTVTVNSLPTIMVTPSTPTVCSTAPNNTVTLQALGAVTYNWNTGANTASITVTPTVNTTYTVSGTDANGCVDSTTSTVNIVVCTGIESYHNALAVNLYPNPSNGQFTIETSNYTENTVLTIYNSIGELVYSTTLTKQVETLNTKLAAGMYTVRLQNQQGTGVQHVVITE